MCADSAVKKLIISFLNHNSTAEVNYFQVACTRNLIFWSSLKEEDHGNPQGLEDSWTLLWKNLSNCNCKPEESRYTFICLKLVVANTILFKGLDFTYVFYFIYIIGIINFLGMQLFPPHRIYLLFKLTQLVLSFSCG